MPRPRPTLRRRRSLAALRSKVGKFLYRQIWIGTPVITGSAPPSVAPEETANSPPGQASG